MWRPDRWERDGIVNNGTRLRKNEKILDDDLPLIAKEYRRLVAEGRFA
jgi:hypothetical protein